MFLSSKWLGDNYLHLSDRFKRDKKNSFYLRRHKDKCCRSWLISAWASHDKVYVGCVEIRSLKERSLCKLTVSLAIAQVGIHVLLFRKFTKMEMYIILVSRGIKGVAKSKGQDCTPNFRRPTAARSPKEKGRAG
jgi:hypothetical protein